ncbi:MAG: hypothetical protein R2800_12200 [Flavipsychrobacter sp.]
MAKLTQNELLEIFNALKKEIKPYQKGNIKPRIDIEGKYDLWVEKDVMVMGKPKSEIYLCGLIIQSNYVGFYFFPVYVEPSMKADLAPDLVKSLKGKSCFHIKKIDDTVLEEVRHAMNVGMEFYKENGWY